MGDQPGDLELTSRESGDSLSDPPRGWTLPDLAELDPHFLQFQLGSELQEDVVDALELLGRLLGAVDLGQAASELPTDSRGVGDHGNLLKCLRSLTHEVDRRLWIPPLPAHHRVDGVGPAKAELVVEASRVLAHAHADCLGPVDLPCPQVCLAQYRKHPVDRPQHVLGPLRDAQTVLRRFDRLTLAGAGLAYGKGTFVAPRTRLFADVFLGESVYGLLELRSDRGEAPTVGAWEARVEQVLVRVSNLGGTLAIQAGRFASPFGSYARRHLTTVDPFIRPPLAYDYRTIMSRTVAPPDADRFLRWKNDPETFRGMVGAPTVWGVPYQWGVMLSGLVGEIQYRGGAMNSAPSSEVEAWGWDTDRFKDPSFVLGAQAPLSADLSLGVSYNRGAYAEREISSGDHTVYTQEMVSLDVTLARGPVMARAEVIRDKWVVPNLSEEPVEWAYGAEVQVDVTTGFSLAVRYGYVDFRSFGDGLGSASSRPDGRSDWDHDIARYEVAVGYRLARNAGVVGVLRSWNSMSGFR